MAPNVSPVGRRPGRWGKPVASGTGVGRSAGPDKPSDWRPIARLERHSVRPCNPRNKNVNKFQIGGHFLARAKIWISNWRENDFSPFFSGRILGKSWANAFEIQIGTKVRVRDATHVACAAWARAALATLDRAWACWMACTWLDSTDCVAAETCSPKDNSQVSSTSARSATTDLSGEGALSLSGGLSGLCGLRHLCGLCLFGRYDSSGLLSGLRCLIGQLLRRLLGRLSRSGFLSRLRRFGLIGRLLGDGCRSAGSASVAGRRMAAGRCGWSTVRRSRWSAVAGRWTRWSARSR